MVYEPDIAGPVSGGECDRATDTCSLTVHGETFEIGPNAHALYGEGRGGSDTLLLYGSDAGTEWYALVGISSTRKRAPCASLDNSDAWDDGNAIIFAFVGDSENDPVVGVRLPKSDQWDEDMDIFLKPDSRFPAHYWWCLDLHGRVSAAYPGGA